MVDHGGEVEGVSVGQTVGVNEDDEEGVGVGCTLLGDTLEKLGGDDPVTESEAE